MRPLFQKLTPRKESLTMENVFAPQHAQQLQTVISQELSIAAEVCHVLRSSPSFKTIPNSRWAALEWTNRRNRETERDKLTESHFLSRCQSPTVFGRGTKENHSANSEVLIEFTTHEGEPKGEPGTPHI